MLAMATLHFTLGWEAVEEFGVEEWCDLCFKDYTVDNSVQEGKNRAKTTQKTMH